MKQLTRDELKDGMQKAIYSGGMHWLNGSDIAKATYAILAYLESVGTVVRRADLVEHMYSERTELYSKLPCYLLLPYDPRPKPQPSAKKRAAELIRTIFSGDTINRPDALALADELEAE